MPRSMNLKDPLLDFEKEMANCIVSTHASILEWQTKVVVQLCPVLFTLSVNLIIIELAIVLHMHELFATGR